ncbi:MAG: hypothetical protein ACR2OB_03055 [Solirubrobacteraceae bacterium]
MSDGSTSSDQEAISPETDRLLDHELQQITGDPDALVSCTYRTPLHAPGIGDVIELRLGLIILALILLLVGAIVILSSGGVRVLIAAIALLFCATAVVVVVTLRISQPTEHPSPELEARLVAEGVGDPDRVMTDLVEDYERRSADPPRPAA